MDPSFINIEEKAAAEKAGDISKEKPAKTGVARVLALTYLTMGQRKRIKDVKGKVSKKRGKLVEKK